MDKEVLRQIAKNSRRWKYKDASLFCPLQTVFMDIEDVHNEREDSEERA
jgi:hypothetical protein